MTSISTAWKTDKGPRPANEDSCVVMTHDDLNGGADALLVVADGMGGRASGATASGIAVEAVARAFASAARVETADDLGGLLSKGIQAANAAVIQAATARPELQGMGATCVAAAIRDDRLDVAHVGDSRAYLLRNGRPLRLTEDHSIVAEKVRSGEMTEEQARGSRFRNVITRAVGLEQSIAPEVNSIELKVGDVVMLCSDGLTGPLRESEIADIVGSSVDPEEACDRLVRAALRSGGSDNVTVAVAAYQPEDARRRRAPARASGRRPGVLIVTAVLGIAIGLLLGLHAESIPLLKLISPREKPAPVVAAGPDLRSVEYGIPSSLAYTPVQGSVLALQGGYLYVMDVKSRLLKLDTTGRVVGGFSADVEFETRVKLLSAPRALDRQGNLYVSDPAKKRIMKYSSDGMFLTAIGEGQLIGPEALVVGDDGGIYLIDGGRLKVIHPKPVS
ncbi:MAG: Stp1/IreP family PP2C-type Ser/Thr phosphatase [Armatimonadetes bacterium]|nr:Stp1/IreP family PP2C-type Ser/Thr phosphatase [Armatimonadota bacterium]